jgi:putative oxidoreductase
MKRFFQPVKLAAVPSFALLLLRLVAGLAFMYHGWGKIQTPFAWMGAQSKVPAFLQGLAALSEFGGGLAWMLGLLTSLASFGMACTMAVATWLHACVLKDPFVASGPGQGAYELAAVYLCVSLLFMLLGPGRWSVDRVLFGEKD